jgi:hypothetical protein
MTHIVSSNVSKARVSKWIMEAKPVDVVPTWTERRLAIEFGGHTYLVANGQVFQCAHCGRYDPEWRAQEVLEFFEENFGIKPHEIEITCSISPVKEG